MIRPRLKCGCACPAWPTPPAGGRQGSRPARSLVYSPVCRTLRASGGIRMGGTPAMPVDRRPALGLWSKAGNLLGFGGVQRQLVRKEIPSGEPRGTRATPPPDQPGTTHHLHPMPKEPHYVASDCRARVVSRSCRVGIR